MAGFGYRRVPDKGFVAFVRELQEGEWGEIALKKLDNDEHMLGPAALSAPPPVLWKLKLDWVLDELVVALQTGTAEAAMALDVSWDSCQRRLFHTLGAASEDDDPLVGAAAGRLKAALLLGNGTAQTTLPYDEEVDFGRKQVALAASDGLKADIKLLKLEPRIEQIEAATEKLAEAMGRGAGGRKGARSIRVREAIATCVVAFNSVHDELTWFVERLPEGKERERVKGLLAPLQALLARYPGVPSSVEPVQDAEPRPNGPTPPGT